MFSITTQLSVLSIYFKIVPFKKFFLIKKNAEISLHFLKPLKVLLILASQH